MAKSLPEDDKEAAKATSKQSTPLARVLGSLRRLKGVIKERKDSIIKVAGGMAAGAIIAGLAGYALGYRRAEDLSIKKYNQGYEQGYQDAIKNLENWTIGNYTAGLEKGLELARDWASGNYTIGLEEGLQLAEKWAKGNFTAGYNEGYNDALIKANKAINELQTNLANLESILSALGYNESNVVYGIVTDIRNENGSLVIYLKQVINDTNVYKYIIPSEFADDFNKSHIKFILQLDALGVNRRNPDGSIRGIQDDPTIIIIGYREGNNTLVPIALGHGWYYVKVGDKLYPVDPENPNAKFIIDSIYPIDLADGKIEGPGIPYLIMLHTLGIVGEPLDEIINDPILRDAAEGWAKTLGTIFEQKS